MRDIRLTKRSFSKPCKLFTDRGESNVTLTDRVFLIEAIWGFFLGENRGRIIRSSPVIPS